MHFRKTDLPIPLLPTMTVVRDSSMSIVRSLQHRRAGERECHSPSPDHKVLQLNTESMTP